MAWDRNDPLNILALQLDGELRAAADFCHGYNGCQQHIENDPLAATGN
ncbi:hypothetical protein KKY53_29415 [Pseudomonas aeruginosa]|nr:hypothetical protein KKY53_29415 [Pseudomonas aeruginosa]